MSRRESGKIARGMYNLIKKLYPISRSITGNGVRQTLKIISKKIPLKIHEIPTGTKVFDWEVPKEWNIKDAYIKDSQGKKIVDFKNSNLHVLNYSIPVRKKMWLKELNKHLYTLPDYPDWIPFLSSYYKENWGFCLTHKQLLGLKDDLYEVVIDSTLEKGHLTYGELYLPGKKKEEILLSCYICHPSLCNDNLSGIALLTFLADYLCGLKRHYSYRFLFIPETIGAITWLCLNEHKISKIKGGLITTCVGDPSPSTYKKTRTEHTLIDKAVEKVLKDSQEPYSIINFDPACGSDERQFCSPGFNLPIGSLMRTPYACFAEYHTSADNLAFIKPSSLENSFIKYLDIIFILENDVTYLNLNAKGEPQLGKRELYRAIGNGRTSINEASLFWVLNFSDGKHSLLDTALHSGIKFKQIKEAADLLLSAKLLEVFED